MEKKRFAELDVPEAGGWQQALTQVDGTRKPTNFCMDLIWGSSTDTAALDSQIVVKFG